MERSLSAVTIRESGIDDFASIMDVEKRAFGYEKEAALVAELLQDASALPLLSLLAFNGNVATGHILFTRAGFRGQESPPLMHILAPLAVRPEYQKKGVGGQLIKTGLDLLRQRGSVLVFVLGHKEYYPKFGFQPYAAHLGFPPPYPMPEENAEYWMVQSLTSNGLSGSTGTIKCADTLDKPQHWRDDENDRQQ